MTIGITHQRVMIDVQEKWYDRLLPSFRNNGHNVMEQFTTYVKYIPKKDLPAVGELINKEIKRLAMLHKKPKEFAWLEAKVQSVMGYSSIVDAIIKDGIKKLIDENPSNAYIRNYLGSLV